jgi:hypothetical protein
MDPILRRILGLSEHEMEGGKLRPETVVYLTPDEIGDPSGARCGGCIFFKPDTSECMLTSPAKCNAEHGVCALFLGRPEKAANAEIKGHPFGLILKTQAGYIEDGPTKCGTCEYWEGGENAEGTCAKVGGKIYKDGCCSHWESDDEEE